MEKGRYKYFIVVQNPEKARFCKRYPYVNKREWTDPSGVYSPNVCKSAEPDANGIYTVDLEAEYAKEKLARLNRVVSKSVDPVIGPFDSVQEAVIAERKLRPLSDKEKLAQADANLKELEILRREKAESELKGNKNR